MKTISNSPVSLGAHLLNAMLISWLATGVASGETTGLPTPGKLTVEQRLKLGCPPGGEAGLFREPSETWPAPEIAFRKMYSDASELIRQTADETSAYSDFAGGDDIAFLYETETGAHVVTGAGNDTVVLCGMNDLGIAIILGDEAGTANLDEDILIIEPLVFDAIPEGMHRSVSVFNFNTETDHLNIRVPQDALNSMQVGPQFSGFRFENLSVRIYPNPLNPRIDYQSDAIIVSGTQ